MSILKPCDGRSAISKPHRCAVSLFFYENIRGDAPNGKAPCSTPHQRRRGQQGCRERGKSAYGTYIEVTDSTSPEASGVANGPIKYRFMLGKDAVKRAAMPRHLLPLQAVTLKFNGKSQRLLWHIDYREEPDRGDVPNPWYVSYLYNHQSNIPFKIHSQGWLRER